MADHFFTNQLINETSPYLLQHAHNPVDWYAWNERTLEKAQTENKMILVSIGYSACHWCHVMEHESFENEEVARLMNEHFICIKVDREERPDVDQVYMDAVQLISGRGGWPLNCFALPDGRPFWGGTYFPREQWMEILKNIVLIYKKEKDKLQQQAEEITNGIKKNYFLASETVEKHISKEDINSMVQTFSSRFDRTEGGIRGAPKFPMPNNYLFLLRYYARSKDPDILKQIELTLDKMAAGGIYDQIGGGFARYSVDDRWHVPHFEKMLYDNAQLVSLYAEAYKLTKKESYRQVVEETLEFIQRELTSPEGSFYSALDADSEGEEGKFYVWTKQEIDEICVEDAGMISDYFGIDEAAYWEEGNNVPVRAKSISKLEEKYNKPKDEVTKILEKNKKKLLKRRSERVRPGLDDKILTSWNALMLKGYVDAFEATGNKEYLNIAGMNGQFMLENLSKSDGGLFHNHKKGKSTINGFLEDYAFVIEAFISLYSSTGEEKWLNEAKRLMDYTISHFYESEWGLFYFTPHENTDLVTRKFEVTDGVIPASNSSISNSLFILGLLFENHTYQQIAEKMLSKVKDNLEKYPTAFSNWGILAMNLAWPFYSVVVCGSESEKLIQQFRVYFLPYIFKVFSVTPGDIPILKNRFVKNKTLIYVCTGSECKQPVDKVENALYQISG
ncbi:MAG: thioredoxin domain-containing protein [Bacteroidales bacterium]|nr:thioredoxin domain-containing protein [Bacteroidales bacterium]